MDKYTARINIKTILDGVLYHECLIDEMLDLVVGKGIEKQFFKKLLSNIEMLKNLGVMAIETKNFEKLRNTNDMYSMKFKGSNMNIRILYSFDALSSTIMLHCFYEKDDSSKESYAKHLPIAIARKREMEEIYEY